MLLTPWTGLAASGALLHLLEDFGFREVPLADSLTSTVPQVRQDEMAAPGWKRSWDEARRLAVIGELSRSVDLYGELLAEKEIVEARWERATILLALGRGGEVIDDIEALCEESPSHHGYLHALAVSNLTLGRFRAGAEAFRRFRALQPESVSALTGLIYSLLAGNERSEAVAPLSVLVQRFPQRADLRVALATLAYEINEFTTAWPYLLELSKELAQPSPSVLQMVAKVSTAIQLPEQAAAYWQRYVTLQPNDLEAQQWLADYYLQRGKTQQALPHLEAVRHLLAGDPTVLKRVGMGYLQIQDYHSAASVLSEYVQIRPGDREAARALVSARQQLNNTTATLSALEHYFAVEPQSDQESLALAARLYGSIGANNEVVAVCRRLLLLQPDNQEILTLMAQHLEAAGHGEEALAAWRQLTRLSPASIHYWRRVALLLERMNRKQELYESLATVHALDPADNSLSVRLLKYYVDERDVGRGMALIADMERFGGVLPDVVYCLRGKLHFQQGDYALALQDLELFLDQNPDDGDARRLAITAAGRLGDTTKVHQHYQLSGRGVNVRSASLLLLVAQAYADCFAESDARVVLQEVVDGKAVEVSDEDKRNAYARLAESFAREDRFYESEESLRIGLAASRDRDFFLPRLVELALSQGQVNDAEQWLAGLGPREGRPSRSVALLEAAVLVERGEMRNAKNLLKDIAADISDEVENTEDRSLAALDLARDRLNVAFLWIAIDKPREAAQQCRNVLAVDPKNLAARALLEKTQSGSEQPTRPIDVTGLKFDQLCDLAEVYGRYEMPDGMARAASLALVQNPDSIKAGLLQVEAFTAQGMVAEALKQLRQTSAANPNDFSLKVRLASMEFMRGKRTMIAALAGSNQGQSRPDLLLLQARGLWADHRWDEALQVYRNFLTPRVSEALMSASQKYGVTLSSSLRKRTVWEVLTRDPGPDRDVEFADQVMTPARSLSFFDQGEGDFALEAARLVSVYRWQAQFALEYAPRQSVVREEYTIAKKQYEALLARYPQERLLLFDLAGMHSALGNLGEEAAAYSALDAAGIEFPELGEAMVRNQLKQQPRTKLDYGYQSDAGRNGYVDRDKKWQGVSVWNSFKPLHDAEVNVERISYHSGSSSDVVRATRAVGSYSAGVLSGLTARGAMGVQGNDRTDRQEFVVSASVVGTVGDGLTGTLSYERDVVDDTTASLRRNILFQDMLGGITLDPLPRLALGGGYLARDYSDNNWTAGYDLWASYLLFAEPTFLQLKYSYDFKESREGPQPGGALEDDGFPVNDHPYWAPKNYWQNQFGMFFKHSLTQEPLGREAPRYYTIEYVIGHDVDGYVTQTAKASLFAEWSANLLVEAGTELATSQSFRRQEYRVGISYRW